MDLLHPQLAAFAAVLEEGSFDAAARRLSISPSALSQRIKALEDRLGQVLVVRQAPCRPTATGEALLRRVRPMQTLEAEALAELLPERGSDAPRTPIPLAVNDDSLDTWFVPAIAELHQRHGYLFDLRMDDQDHTLQLLRDGSVLGAVTAESQPVKGCNVHPLGAMRYHAIASPGFARRHFSEGMQAAALARAPMLVFNRKDELQWRFVRRLTRARLQPPLHYLPPRPASSKPPRADWAGAWPRKPWWGLPCMPAAWWYWNPAAGSTCPCTGSTRPCAQARCSTSPRHCARRPAAPCAEVHTMTADPGFTRRPLTFAHFLTTGTACV